MSFAAAKLMPARSKGAGAPSDQQLAQIRQFCLNEMAADQLYTRSFVLAHNCIDRDDEVFDEGLLADFKSTLPGKGIFIKHPMSWDGDSGPAEGKWYGAALQTMTLDEARALLKQPDLQLPPDRTTVTLLVADGYFAKTPENTGLLTKMDAGIAGDVSIGFSASSRQPIKDAQGRELQAQRIVGPGEALEGSLVWLGAQPGARAIKSATRHNNQPEGSAMDQKEFDKQISDANAKAAALEPHKQFHEALKTALGKDHAPLAENANTLATLAIAGKSAMAEMVEDLVAADRHQGAVGDKPEEVDAAKAAYSALPFAQLKALHIIAAKRGGVPARAPASAVRGGNPNVTGAEGEKALGDDHPLSGLLQFANVKVA